MNAYETLCEIYDRGQARIDSMVPVTMSIEDRGSLRPLVRTLTENVATYVLNYTAQVLNGGHQQWVDNDYLVDDHESLLLVLRMINGPCCKKVIKNVEAVLKYCGEDLCMPYDECDPEEDDLSDPFGPLDTSFYKYDKEFCEEVLTWVRTQDLETAKVMVKLME